MTDAGIRTSLVKDGIIPKLVKLLKKAQFRHVALKLVKALRHHFTHFNARCPHHFITLLLDVYIRHVALKLVKALSHHFTHFTTIYIYQALIYIYIYIALKLVKALSHHSLYY